MASQITKRAKRPGCVLMMVSVMELKVGKSSRGDERYEMSSQIRNAASSPRHTKTPCRLSGTAASGGTTSQPNRGDAGRDDRDPDRDGFRVCKRPPAGRDPGVDERAGDDGDHAPRDAGCPVRRLHDHSLAIAPGASEARW